MASKGYVSDRLLTRQANKKTYLTMLDNFCFMKYVLKSVPGLADVGVLHGDGNSPRTSP